jgi:hypothetical protein
MRQKNSNNISIEGKKSKNERKLFICKHLLLISSRKSSPAHETKANIFGIIAVEWEQKK